MRGRGDAAKKAFAVYFDQARELRLYKRAEAPQAGESFDGGVAGVVMEGIEHEGFSWDSRARRARRVMVVDEGMFERCRILRSLDLSGVDTSGVEDMSRMFGGYGSLEELDLSGVKRPWGMLDDCPSLSSETVDGVVRAFSGRYRRAQIC